MSIAREIISFALKTGASDIHIEEGSPLALRVNSEIKISQQIINKLKPSKLKHILYTQLLHIQTF